MRRMSWAMLAVPAMILATYAAMADEPHPIASETREFEILVDDAKAGATTSTITEFDDGRSVVSTTAEVKVKILVYNYVYQFSGAEEWLGNQFRGLDSRTVDGLSKLSLKVRLDGERMVLQGADGKPRATTPQVMTTNYWRQPPDELLGKKIAVLDADNGRTLKLQFDHVGPKTLTLLGKPVDCQHFKVTGDLQSELWFDGSQRLVRRLGTEDGHKTEARLTGYRKR